MPGFEDALMFLGSSICHQLAERSYFYEGTQMPLCARCIGIHVGFAISTIFLAAVSRRHALGLPSLRQMAAMGAIMSVFVVDALLSYSGLSESTNLRRTLSGLCMGVVIPFILFPILNMVLHPGRESARFLDKWTGWLWIGLLYLLAASLILLSERSTILFYTASVLGVAGVFVFMSTLASVEVALLLDKSKMPNSRKLAIGVAIAVVALLSSATVRQMV